MLYTKRYYITSLSVLYDSIMCDDLKTKNKNHSEKSLCRIIVIASNARPIIKADTSRLGMDVTNLLAKINHCVR